MLYISKAYDEGMSMSENSPTVEALHDLLLSSRPSGASHDVSLCPICAESTDGNDSHTDAVHGGGDVSTYTQDELEAQVSAAVTPIQVKLDELLASQEQAAIEAKLAEVTKTHESEVAEIQGKLDQAMADVEAGKTLHEGLVSFLETEQARIDAESTLKIRREEVASLVEGMFSKEYVEKNLDRWASMEADTFEDTVGDWKAAAVSNDSDTTNTKNSTPVSTAMQNSADQAKSKSISDIRRELQMNRNSVRAVGASTV